MSAQKETPPEIQITVFTPELNPTKTVNSVSYERESKKITVSNLDDLDELKKYKTHHTDLKNAEKCFTFSGIRVIAPNECYFDEKDEEALLKSDPSLAVSLRSLSDGTTSIFISGTHRNAETSDTDFTSMYHLSVESIKERVNYLLGLLEKTDIISYELATEAGFTPDYTNEEKTIDFDCLPT